MRQLLFGEFLNKPPRFSGFQMSSKKKDESADEYTEK
jgi:hypothetical protein